jgi:hypothetical protein
MDGMWSHNKQPSAKIFARNDHISIDRKSTLLIYSIDLLGRSAQSTELHYSLIRASKNLRTWFWLSKLEARMAEAASKRLGQRRNGDAISEKLEGVRSWCST